MDGRSCWHSLRRCGHLLDVSLLPIPDSNPADVDLIADDSAAHVSEESAGAARAAPLAILIGVAGTAGLGWILLIAASFATNSVSDLLTTTLPLPMGQLFLDTLGKRGMLALWSFIIVVQVRALPGLKAFDNNIFGAVLVCYWSGARRRRFPRCLCLCKR